MEKDTGKSGDSLGAGLVGLAVVLLLVVGVAALVIALACAIENGANPLATIGASAALAVSALSFGSILHVVFRR